MAENFPNKLNLNFLHVITLIAKFPEAIFFCTTIFLFNFVSHYNTY